MKVLRTTITSSGEDCRSELCHLVDLISFDIAHLIDDGPWVLDDWWYTTPPKFKKKPLKFMGKLEDLPIGKLVTFQGRTVKLWGIFFAS